MHQQNDGFSGFHFMKWTSAEIAALERFYRANLINSVTGFKSLCLLGTIGPDGQTNLAVFTQVFHIGAAPALIGIVFRPQVPGMHSLSHIRSSGIFTLNHVKEDESMQAHHTSARWEQSEFTAVGLEAEFLEGFAAPFVKGSRIRMAMKPEQEIHLDLNDTTLLIASVQYLEVPDHALCEDGFADLIKAGSLAGSGLDAYVVPAAMQRFSYARTGEKPRLI